MRGDEGRKQDHGIVHAGVDQKRAWNRRIARQRESSLDVRIARLQLRRNRRGPSGKTVRLRIRQGDGRSGVVELDDEAGKERGAENPVDPVAERRLKRLEIETRYGRQRRGHAREGDGELWKRMSRAALFR